VDRRPSGTRRGDRDGRLRARPALRRTRVFAGYAGWGPDQLDSELEQEAWIVEAAHPADPFADGDLWAQVLRRKGGEYALLARMPPDPASN
jgi:putative transcriptional regulator